MTHLTLIPVISGLRPFVWLARLEVMRLEHAGDPAGAFRHLRAILQASRHCGRHGGLTERIVGMSFHRIAVDGLIHWAHLPIVQTEPLHAALAESRAAFETTALPSGPIRVDYLICRHTLEDPLARLTELSQNLADDLQMDWRWSYFEGEPELSRRLIRCVYANWLSQCDLPHSQRAPFVGTRLDLFDCPSNTTTGGARLSAETLSDLVWRSPYAGRVMFSIKYFLERHDSEQALQLLLETALQLQIYYRQHGDFPESLDKLAESFGEQAPIDQFGRGKPLRYRLSRDAADGATVWSVGPDETDDAAHQNLPDGRGDDKDIVIHVLPPATAH